MERFPAKDGPGPAGQKNRERRDFCGWYFKCQAPAGSLALIPAVHAGGGSLQLITEGGSWNVPFAPEECAVSAARPRAVLGRNVFCEKGLRLAVDKAGLRAKGRVRFGPLLPPAWDVMGPFCAVPFLQCRHRVASMAHDLSGRLEVNGRVFDFGGGRGYIEGDRGRSFPSDYLWTQCLFEGGSLVLAAANVPLGPAAFRGVIALVRLEGKEWRLASYLGARVTALGGGGVTVRQGELCLTARRLGGPGRALRAPAAGVMERTVRENLSCPAYYRLTKGGRVLLELTAEHASFEYEQP